MTVTDILKVFPQIKRLRYHLVCVTLLDFAATRCDIIIFWDNQQALLLLVALKA